MKYSIESDASSDGIKSIIENFLRCQIGAGADKSEPNDKQVYSIDIQLDMADDSFTCEHDCGNLGLRDGILMFVLSELE